MEASDAFDRTPDSTNTDDDLHEKLDALARRVEAAIRDGREILDAISDFEEGRSTRAEELDEFMRKFGKS